MDYRTETPYAKDAGQVFQKLLVGFSVGTGLEAKQNLRYPRNSMRKCLSSLISILNNEKNYVLKGNRLCWIQQ